MTTRTLLLFNAALTLAVLVNLLGCLWWNCAISQGVYHSWASPDGENGGSGMASHS